MELTVQVTKLEGELELVKSKIQDFDKKIDKYDTKTSAYFTQLDEERKKTDKMGYQLETTEKNLELYQIACEKKFEFLKKDFAGKLENLKTESETNDAEIREMIESHDKKLKEKEEKKSRTRLGFILAWGGIILTWLLTYIAN